jgi:hypothetical protein
MNSMKSALLRSFVTVYIACTVRLSASPREQSRSKVI